MQSDSIVSGSEQAIAESANTILAEGQRCRGRFASSATRRLISEVSDFVTDPDAVLGENQRWRYRGAVTDIPQQRMAVVGGTKDVKDFVWAAGKAPCRTRHPSHRDLACFTYVGTRCVNM
jgi:hypothetical protein